MHRPNALEVALCRVVVYMAVAVIAQERLNERVRHQTHVADSLRAALQMNRDIGPAVGIVMATRHMSHSEGIALLRAASQRAQPEATRRHRRSRAHRTVRSEGSVGPARVEHLKPVFRDGESPARL